MNFNARTLKLIIILNFNLLTDVLIIRVNSDWCIKIALALFPNIFLLNNFRSIHNKINEKSSR